MQRSITDRVDFSKFGIPSWRIEQKYSPGVLIGNWSEERLKFPDTKYPLNTTHRIDFKNYGEFHPDVTIRRKAVLNSEGLPADFIFRHHDNAYDNMLITMYDEHYNGRWREKNLPPLRQFDSQTLGWLPERSDYPLKGPPTNFGLKEHKEALALARQKELELPDFESTYMDSYRDKPKEAFCYTRHATPKHLSTSLLPSNNINSNLHFRGKPLLRIPEILPQELTQISI